MNKLYFKKTLILLLIAFSFVNLALSQTINWTQKANPLFNAINGLAFSGDGQKVISGTNCHPASIRIIDVDSATINWDYTVGSNFMCIMGVAFTSDSKYIAAIEEFGNLLLFDNSGTSPVLIDTIVTETDYAFSFDISSDDKYIMVGCSNGKLKIYDIIADTLVKEWIAHPSWVMTVGFSPDGTKIVSGGNDNKVKIWSMSGILLYTCSGHTDDISKVTVTHNNQFAISSSKDKKIKIWNISNGLLVRTLSGHTQSVNSVDLSPDGKKIVSAGTEGNCKIWDFDSGNELLTFGVPDSGAINAVAWSPISNTIVSGNVVSDLVLWSLPTSLDIKPNEPDANINIYPNPANSSFRIDFLGEETALSLEIIDINGKQVLKKDQLEKSNLMDISALQKSIYLLKISNEKTTKCYKIIKLD